MVQLDNDIAVEPHTPAVLEQVVALSIVLTGEMYSDKLDDPSSLQFQTLSRQLVDKVRLWLLCLLFFMTLFISCFLVCDGCAVSFNNTHLNSGSQSGSLWYMINFGIITAIKNRHILYSQSYWEKWRQLFNVKKVRVEDKCSGLNPSSFFEALKGGSLSPCKSICVVLMA